MNKKEDVILVLKWEDGLHEEKEIEVEKNDRVETTVTKDYKKNIQTTEIKMRCTPITLTYVDLDRTSDDDK